MGSEVIEFNSPVISFSFEKTPVLTNFNTNETFFNGKFLIHKMIEIFRNNSEGYFLDLYKSTNGWTITSDCKPEINTDSKIVFIKGCFNENSCRFYKLTDKQINEIIFAFQEWQKKTTKKAEDILEEWI